MLFITRFPYSKAIEEKELKGHKIRIKKGLLTKWEGEIIDRRLRGLEVIIKREL